MGLSLSASGLGLPAGTVEIPLLIPAVLCWWPCLSSRAASALWGHIGSCRELTPPSNQQPIGLAYKYPSSLNFWGTLRSVCSALAPHPHRDRAPSPTLTTRSISFPPPLTAFPCLCSWGSSGESPTCTQTLVSGEQSRPRLPALTANLLTVPQATPSASAAAADTAGWYSTRRPSLRFVDV